MNEQKGGTVAPLFYIIQPMIEIKRSAQNNQEIFHSREVFVETPIAPIEAEQGKTVMDQSKKEIQEEVKQLSSEFNIPGNIQAKAMKKMEAFVAAMEEEPVLLEDDAIGEAEIVVAHDQDRYADESMEDHKKNVRTKITRLARYPLVVPKPLCELTVQGEKVNAIIESKRGEMIRLRVGEVSQSIPIDDIEDVKLL